MKKILIILGALVVLAIACVISFLVGVFSGVGDGAKIASEKIAAEMKPRVAWVNLSDDLWTTHVASAQSKVIVYVNARDGAEPDRVSVDYVNHDNHEVLKTQVVSVQTNDRGGRLVELDVPDFGHLVNVEIRKR